MNSKKKSFLVLLSQLGSNLKGPGKDRKRTRDSLVGYRLKI